MLDLIRPATSKPKPPAATSAPPSPIASPASSTSTLKASSSSAHNKPSSTTARSRGQQARRQSIEYAVSSSHRHRDALRDRQGRLLDLNLGASSSSSRSSPALVPFRRSTLASDPTQTAYRRPKQLRSSDAGTIAVATPASSTADAVLSEQHSRTRKRSRAQQPLLGGLYLSDLIVVAFFYAVNLLRTCGIAELVDVAFKALAYVCTRLPFDFYQRWSLSRPPPNLYPRYPPFTAQQQQQYEARSAGKDARQTSKAKAHAQIGDVPSPQMSRTSSTAVSAITSSSKHEASSQDQFEQDAQLSPFHHLTILLVRFACTSFPHLVPRVLFAEETIGPLVRWRTGGGAAGIVREFTSEQSPSPALPTASTKHASPSPPHSGDTSKAKPHSKRFQTFARPGFRAFWIGADAHVPVEVRRSDPSSKSASTLLYLHGGGFSLGSVAFYAEALIRIITKVCSMEDRDNDARCIAVEYDLGPTSRFPGPLLQCLRCYAHLIEVEEIHPTSITVAGDSAGGNLTMAMLLCLDGQAGGDESLAERDWSKLPMPGKAVLISPWADLRPSASKAFTHLREKQSNGRQKSREASFTDSVGSRVSTWTEAIGQHEWDYVAAEALMHFAQLYAGVLKTPRRVRGPMGWVAHMCAVLAGDQEDTASASSTDSDVKTGGKDSSPSSTAASAKSATAPLAILRTLLLPPSQRIARVAHNMLTEPLLNRATSVKSTFSSSATSKQPAPDAFNAVEHIRPSAVGALDPIFPAAERKTDAVPGTADLFVPIWNTPSFASEQKEEEAKRDSSDPDLEAAKALLETSKLVNPAIGDWSRIRLKRGMLATWGDKERLADDIKVWVDHVRQSQSQRGRQHATAAATAPYDQPSQDLDPAAQPKSLQERRAASRSPHRGSSEHLPEDGNTADWLCTAVEHGPGGVHAWPFVSMYLAGTEAEREKGLEVIARFIAEPTLSPASTHQATPASLAVQLPVPHDERYLSAAAAAAQGFGAVGNSPPHLNSVSPAGSMPSDISSRGDVDDGDYPFLGGSSYTWSEAEDWDPAGGSNELGLEGVYPHEIVWAEPTPAPSTGVGTPVSQSDDGEGIGHDELVRQVGLGLGGAAASGRAAGSMMEPVHLHRPAHNASSTTAGWDQYTHLAEQQQRTTRSSSRRTRPDPPASTALGSAPTGRSLADLEAESDLSAPPSRPGSPGGWHSSGANSGYTSTDDLSAAASPQEVDRDAYFGGPVSYADDEIPMDPGFYGLAHYHTLRPEGLSDIAEEESQFDTSSVLSSGNGGIRSPGLSESFSPADGSSPTRNPGRLGAAYTPSASEMARLREALEVRERQYRDRFGRGKGRRKGRGRFPIEEEEGAGEGGVDSIGEGSGAEEVSYVDDEEQRRRSPWESSVELPTLADPQAERGVGDAASKHLNVAVNGNVTIPAMPSRRSTELFPAQPPSPARSTCSQNSKDIWW
ncbi:hypothetical protein NDA14_004171 [Ustilago hordei]|nr:hypothetical protein NDA14_004171 [Ustilago hordei]